MAADLGPRPTAAVAAGRGDRQERSGISLAALLVTPASDRPRSHIGVIGVNLRPQALLSQRRQTTKLVFRAAAKTLVQRTSAIGGRTRRVGFSRLPERQREVPKRLTILRRETCRTLKGVEGSVRLLPHESNRAERVPCLRVIWCDRERLTFQSL